MNEQELPVGWCRVSVVLPPARAFVAQSWADEAARERTAWEAAPSGSRGEFYFSDDLQYRE